EFLLSSSQEANVVIGEANMCITPPSLADISEGTPVSLRTPDGEQLATAPLTYKGGSIGTCTFGFTFVDIPAGEDSYVLAVPGRGNLDVSEAELRQGPSVTLGE